MMKEQTQVRNRSVPIGVALILLFSVGVTIYFGLQGYKPQQKQANHTQNTETYMNPRYHYSFSYQPNDKLKAVSCAKYNGRADSGDERFILYDASITCPYPSSLCLCSTQEEGHIITVTILDNKDDCQNTESWTNTSSIAVIDGITAYRCRRVFVGERLYPDLSEITDVFIPSDNHYVTITLRDDRFLETYDQIISSFEFTQ